MIHSSPPPVTNSKFGSAGARRETAGQGVHVRTEAVAFFPRSLTVETTWQAM